MKNRKVNTLMETLKKISKADSIKMSYIFSHLEEINKKYSLNLSYSEKKALLDSRNMTVRNMRNPFDISGSMRPR